MNTFETAFENFKDHAKGNNLSRGFYGGKNSNWIKFVDHQAAVIADVKYIFFWDSYSEEITVYKSA